MYNSKKIIYTCIGLIVILLITSSCLFFKSFYFKLPSNSTVTTNNNTNVIPLISIVSFSLIDIQSNSLPKLPYYIPEKYKSYVIQLCIDNSLPLWLFARMISKESVWIVNAKHRKYDTELKQWIIDGIGLGQLFEPLIEIEYEWKFNDGKHIDPLNVYDNLRVSARILAWAYRCSGNYYDALAIYNAGYGKYIRNRIPSCTIDYIIDILYNPSMRLKNKFSI